jgi:hypothetical protein
MSIRLFYDHWHVYNQAFIDVLGSMTDEQLAIAPGPDRWPVWATAGHTPAARVYWLCGVFGEPGADATPWPNPLTDLGWEDDLDTPRRAEELVHAFESTWPIIDGVLERWTPEMLEQPFRREISGKVQHHTRTSVLQRMLSHEAYHAGELSQTLGIAGLPQIDLWKPGT